MVRRQRLLENPRTSIVGKPRSGSGPKRGSGSRWACACASRQARPRNTDRCVRRPERGFEAQGSIGRPRTGGTARIARGVKTQEPGQTPVIGRRIAKKRVTDRNDGRCSMKMIEAGGCETAGGRTGRKTPQVPAGQEQHCEGHANPRSAAGVKKIPARPRGTGPRKARRRPARRPAVEASGPGAERMGLTQLGTLGSAHGEKPQGRTAHSSASKKGQAQGRASEVGTPKRDHPVVGSSG